MLRTGDEVNDAIQVALSGIAERPMTADVVSLAHEDAPMLPFVYLPWYGLPR
jgi:hypothetical protein